MPRLATTDEELKAHVKLIADYGGPTAVSRAINEHMGKEMSSQAVSNWMRRGIPFDYRGPLVVLGQAKGVSIPADFFGTKARTIEEDT